MNPSEAYRYLSRQPPEVVRNAIRAYLAKMRLASFITWAWPIHHHAEKLLWNWHIGCIAEHLEAAFLRQIRWLVINIPPGFMKSLICSVYYPAWVWLRKPSEQFLVVSSVEDVVYRDAGRHMGIVTGRSYNETFQVDWGMSKIQCAKSHFVNTENGSRVSRTVGSGGVGLRASTLIGDDMNHPRKTMGNSALQDETNEFVDGVEFRQRRNHHDDPIILVQQRLAGNDVTGYVLRKARPGTVHLVLPNEFRKAKAFSSPIINSKTGEPWTDQRTEEDQLLHPGIKDAEATAEDKSAGNVVYQATGQQDPMPLAGNIFKRDMFKRWVPIETEATQARGAIKLPGLDEFPYLVMSCDLNALEDDAAPNKDTDYALFDIWGPMGDLRYLVRQERKPLGRQASEDMIIELLELFPQIRKVLIERAANAADKKRGPTGERAPGVIKTLKARLGIPENDDQFIEGIVVQGRSKVQRAMDVLPIVSANRVVIPDENEYGDFNYWLSEVTGFPGPKRDDRVDTMTMALDEMERADFTVWSGALKKVS
jgi:predicted phage terminase large subunit-like protein